MLGDEESAVAVGNGLFNQAIGSKNPRWDHETEEAEVGDASGDGSPLQYLQQIINVFH